MSTDSNQVIPQESYDVVDWEEEMARQATAAAAIERPKVGQISTRAGMLSYQQVPIAGNKMNCIVVASIYERDYYVGKFDSNNLQSPACYAFSEDGVDMVPHESIPKPINVDCDSCPYSEWGSDPNSPSKRGKLCKQIRKLALVAFNDKGNYDNAELAIMRVPVTSVPNWSMYVTKLAGGAKRPHYAVVTEIALTPDLKTQFQVNFQLAAKLDIEQFGVIYKLRELALKVLTTPYDPTTDEVVKESTKY